MSAVLRGCAVALAAASIVGELRSVLQAPGVVLILGGCAAAYLWFVAVARAARAAGRSS